MENVTLENMYKEILDKKQKRLILNKKIKDLEVHIKETKDKKDVLKKIFDKETKDVKKLEGFSLSRLVFVLKGSDENVYNKEKREAVIAQYKYKEVNEDLQELENRYKLYVDENIKLENIDQLEKEWMDKKEKLLKETNNLDSSYLEILNKRAVIYSNLKEIDEALVVGKELLKNLNDAKKLLNSAENWGAFDMLGGGIIATSIKHGKMDDANDKIREAQIKLKNFERELKDVDKFLDCEIEVGGFSNFADYFLDGFIFDSFVQSKILNSLDSVKEVIKSIEKIILELESNKKEKEKDIEKSEEKRMNWLSQK